MSPGHRLPQDTRSDLTVWFCRYVSRCAAGKQTKGDADRYGSKLIERYCSGDPLSTERTAFDAHAEKWQKTVASSLSANSPLSRASAAPAHDLVDRGVCNPYTHRRPNETIRNREETGWAE